MSFTLAQLVWAVRSRKLGITAETSASLVLALAEQLALAPRVLALHKVTLTQSGQLFFDEGQATSARAADLALRILLGELLLHTGGDHPALAQCAVADAEGLESLCGALLKALVPLNRAAAKRGLSRLHRRLSVLSPPLGIQIDLQCQQALAPVALRSKQSAIAPEHVEPSVELDDGYLELDDQYIEFDDESPVQCFEGTPIVGVTPRVDARPRITSLSSVSTLQFDSSALQFDSSLSELESDPPTLRMTPRRQSSGAAWPLPALPAMADRTPFLGSMNVHAAAVAVHAEPAECSAPQQRAASAALAQASVGAARGRSEALIFGRFKAKRSDTGELLKDFELESKLSDHKVAVALRRCVGLRQLDPEASCTPPPVGWLVPLSPGR